MKAICVKKKCVWRNYIDGEKWFCPFHHCEHMRYFENPNKKKDIDKKRENLNNAIKGVENEKLK